MCMPPFKPVGDGSSDLLPLALSRPNEALQRARAVLARDHDPLKASVARQAIGIVLREYGDIEAAIGELRIARNLARRAGSADREADVLSTLGFTLVVAGRTVAGRNALNAAVRQSTGHLHGRILFRRGAALLILGRHSEALEDVNSAVAAMRMAGDQIWEARALEHRALSYISSGSVRRAVADLRRAEELFTANGQELESVDAAVHRGVLALRLGDLPDALACFDEAAERYQRLGTSEPDLSMHRCVALTAAGLAKDAIHEAEAAISQLDRIHGRPTKRAELLLTAARCALAAGESATALARAAEARRLFDRQGQALVAGARRTGAGECGCRRRPGDRRPAPGCAAMRPGAVRSLLARPAARPADYWPSRFGAWTERGGQRAPRCRGRWPSARTAAVPGDRVAGRGAAC